MKRSLAIAVLLASVAVAQDLAPTQGDLAKNSQLTNTVTLNLFVDGTLGSDSNACTASGASACATIQAAINKIPKRMQQPANVTIASGNYTGAYIYNFQQEGNVTPANGAFMTIAGTLITATPTTGPATGTFTSTTCNTGSAFDVFTLSTATWTASDLRRFLLVITGGTGAGQTAAIVDNTATTMTISHMHNPCPDATSTFAIDDWGTVINSAVALPAGPNTGSVAGAGGLLITDTNTTNRTDGRYSIQKIKFSGISVGIRTEGFANIRYNSFATTGSGSLGAIRSFTASRLEVDDNYATLPAGGRFLAVDQSNTVPMTLAVQRNVVDNGAICLDVGIGWLNTIGNSCKNQTIAAFRLENILGGLLQEDRLNCNSQGGSVGIQWFGGNTTKGSGILAAQSYDISNCPTAHSLVGKVTYAVVFPSSGVTGSSNTTGINVSEGASFITNTGYALGATTEITIEGNNFTLANMRAQSPKSIVDMMSGARVYEQ